MQENQWLIQDSKECLKDQLFTLLEIMPKSEQTTTTLRYIVEELLADIISFSSNEKNNAQLLLSDAYIHIRKRIDIYS